MKKVAVIMGSESDLPIVEKGVAVLREFGINPSVRVLSAHRSPGEAAKFAKNAEELGFGVIIAAAGMAAHLAGAIAANTVLPVIAVPLTTKSKTFDGMDALLSSVMMPPGVPVACVAVDGAANAAYLAVQILALEDKELTEKFRLFKENGRLKNLEADRRIGEKYGNR